MKQLVELRGWIAGAMRAVKMRRRGRLDEAQRRWLVMAMAMGLGFCLIGNDAFAGTDGAEFAGTYTMVTGWMTGYLGKVISVGAVLAGLAAGAFRQNLWAALAGIGVAVIMQFTPTVVDAVVTATLQPL